MYCKATYLLRLLVHVMLYFVKVFVHRRIIFRWMVRRVGRGFAGPGGCFSVFWLHFREENLIVLFFIEILLRYWSGGGACSGPDRFLVCYKLLPSSVIENVKKGYAEEDMITSRIFRSVDLG